MDIEIPNNVDAFLLDIVNRPVNNQPHFINGTWRLWSMEMTGLSYEYTQSIYIILICPLLEPRLKYILNNMWPVECDNIDIEINNTDAVWYINVKNDFSVAIFIAEMSASVVVSATPSKPVARWWSNTEYVTGLTDVEFTVYCIVNHANNSTPRLKEDWVSGRCFWSLFKADLDSLDQQQLMQFQSQAFHDRLKFVMVNMWPFLATWKFVVAVENDELIVKTVSVSH